MNNKSVIVLVSVGALALAALLLLWLGAASQVRADPGKRYVAPSPTGNDTGNDCSNAGSPCATIQHAINVAQTGDEIHVASGTYNEHIAMADGVSIHGQGWLSTIIDGGYSMSWPTVYIPPGVSASTVLSGVQITGGGTGKIATSVQNGGGVAIWDASPSIVNTWVYSCTAQNGGGVYVNAGSPTFDNVPVWSSRAQDGGGFYLGNGAVVTITGNPSTPCSPMELCG